MEAKQVHTFLSTVTYITNCKYIFIGVWLNSLVFLGVKYF